MTDIESDRSDLDDKSYPCTFCDGSGREQCWAACGGLDETCDECRGADTVPCDECYGIGRVGYDPYKGTRFAGRSV